MAPIARVLPASSNQKLAERTARRTLARSGSKAAGAKEPAAAPSANNPISRGNDRVIKKPTGKSTTTHAEAQIGIPHRASSFGPKPIGHQNLVRDRPGQDISHYFCDAEQIVLPKAMYASQENQRPSR